MTCDLRRFAQFPGSRVAAFRKLLPSPRRLELQIAPKATRNVPGFCGKLVTDQSPLDFPGVLHVTPRYRFLKAFNLQQLLRAGKPSQTVCLPHSPLRKSQNAIRVCAQESREIAKRINYQKGSALVADITENLQPRATL